MNHIHDWISIENQITVCKDKDCDAELGGAVVYYPFSQDEINALKRLLEKQYINYEDIEALNVTRRIMEIADDQKT